MKNVGVGITAVKTWHDRLYLSVDGMLSMCITVMLCNPSN